MTQIFFSDYQKNLSPDGLFNFKSNQRENSKENSAPDFSSLLTGRLASLSIHNTTETGKLFQPSSNPASIIRPWERPEIKMPEKPPAKEKVEFKEKNEHQTSKSEIDGSEKAVGESDKVEQEKAVRPEETEKDSNFGRDSETTGEVSEKAMTTLDYPASEDSVQLILEKLEENPELAKLTEGLSDQELKSLIEVIGELSPEALEDLQKNPELLMGEVEKLIQALSETDSSEFVSENQSSDFQQLISSIAAATAGIKSEEASENSELEAVSEVETPQSKKSPKPVEVHGKLEASEASTSIESLSETQGENVAEAESDGATSESHHTEKSVKKAESVGEKVQMSEERMTKNDVAQPAVNESLRQAFKRENKIEAAVSSESQALADTEVPVTQSSASHAPELVQAQTAQSDGTGIWQNLARKIIASLQEGSQSSRPQAVQLEPGSSASQKQNQFHHNSNGGSAGGQLNSQNYGNGATIRQMPTPASSTFLSQLLEKAEMFKTSDGKKVLSLEMDPKELGKMEMELTSKDGTVTAKISAESDLAKARLEELAPQIKEHLSSQGINLAEITVDISSQHPDERNNKQMTDRKNKSSRAEKISSGNSEQVIRQNILPNLRKIALKIQSVDVMV